MAEPQPTSGGVILPSPPFIHVEGIPNFRDLGGYPVSKSPSASIRRNYIYRCGEPGKVTPLGIEKLQSLGIAYTYDLRSINEIQRNIDAGRGGVVGWDGCERVFAPVFKEEDYSPEGIAARFKHYATGGPEGFTLAYTDILNNAPPSYKVILRHLAHEPEKPLIVHCTAGKDRTGVLCALILGLCGVEDDDIAREYELTQLGLAEYTEKIIQHLMHNPALNGDPEGAKRMLSASAPNMIATLQMIREKYGGSEGYMTEKCGLTSDELDKIKKNLIVEAIPVHEQRVIGL